MKTIIKTSLCILLVILISQCKKEDPEPPAVIASFQFAIDAADSFKVSFTNSSEHATSYVWDFGDMATSTEANPVHTYAVEGTYSVKLLATGDGGTEEITKNVSIVDEVDIADANFLSALIDEGVDINGDGIISKTEAALIDSLNISLIMNLNRITDSKGIEAFSNLSYLDFSGHDISSLDVSNMTSLTHLDFSINDLTSLDVSNNTALISLICSSNYLTNLDISNNTALEYLDCRDNILTSLDVSSNTNLVTLSFYWNSIASLDVSNNTSLNGLSCGDNDLTSLDVSNNISLTHLDCDKNSLTILDISNNTALQRLNAHYNQLTSLDLSANTALNHLNVDGNLFTTIDLRNNPVLTFISLSEMPSLINVCVWIMPFPPAGIFVNTFNSPNVTFTTTCN